jgi:hypothetical protein
MLPKSVKNLLSNPREATSELLSEINDAVSPKDFPTMEQMPKNLAENNISENKIGNELLSTGKMQFLDIDISETDGSVRLRNMTELEEDLDYVVIRLKASIPQLQEEGIKFKVWFPQ